VSRRLVVLVVLVAAAMPAPASAAAAHFRVGAASVSFTPAAAGGPVHDPADCLSAAGGPFGGARPFAFEEPYLDLTHAGHYQLGDPFLDCNGDGRWDGNTLGGGGNSPRFYDHVADPVGARALVVANGTRTIAMEVVDNEGLFNTYADRIRARVAADGYRLANIQISSTHDESAPDTIGLGGVNELLSGVNEYFAGYLVRQSAVAIERAYDSMRPARIRYAQAREPANFVQCWSSYPFIDNQLMPVLQAVGTDGRVIATLADVGQHVESLGFDGGSRLDPAAPAATTLDQENRWVSADWTYWFRRALEETYGGVGIEMAGAVGSVETPEVLSEAVTRTPQGFVDGSHPAGCRTLWRAPAGATEVPLGYFSEVRAEGEQLAGAVEAALASGAAWSHTDTIWAQTSDLCVPVQNLLFKAAAVAGTFAERAAYLPGCRKLERVPALPTGQTAGTSLRSEAAAWRIGDAEFVGAPGEVFPFTFFRGPVGPRDLNYPQYALPPWPLPYMHTPWRFFDGLDNDMIGYIFPRGNDAGVPGAHLLKNPGFSDTDRFGCGHSDDSEAVNDRAADIVGRALVAILKRHARASESVEVGRYVLADGTRSRNPLGRTDTVKCTPAAGEGFDTTGGPAVAVWEPGRGIIHPAAWIDLYGRRQGSPDRDTRGYLDRAGRRHWLDVYPDISASASAPSTPASSPRAGAARKPSGSGR
jgi:hypothetical protein